MPPPHTQVIDTVDKVEEVKRLVDKIDKDMILNFTLLNERIKALERQAPTAPAVGASLGMLDLLLYSRRYPKYSGPTLLLIPLSPCVVRDRGRQESIRL